MAGRIVAAFAAVVLFALLAAFTIPLVIGVPAPTVLLKDLARPVATLNQPTSIGLLRAELFLLPNLGYQIDLLVSRDADAPSGTIRPIVIVEMVGMDMGRAEPPLQVIATGEFSAAGSLPMPGQWRFRVGFGNELFDMLVSVPEASASLSTPASSSFGPLANYVEEPGFE